MNDTERFDWLEKLATEGYATHLVDDDDGRFALCFDSFQPDAPVGGFNEEVSIVVYVDPVRWKPTIREAIDYAKEVDDREREVSRESGSG